jgi:succinate-semialdehyde dehydrogenase/glutarate-semialdehyde dehydrogenase
MATFTLSNPSTGENEQTFTRLDDSERDAVLTRATDAYTRWRETDIDERAAVLRRAARLYRDRADELASHIGREMGKLTRWGKAEIGIVADIYRWYAEHAHELLADRELPAQGATRTWVRKDPVGPLLGIMPWNFPYYQVARWAAPNLLLGNSLVLKHASICPLSSQACQDILVEAGLPEGVFQNIYASGSQMDAFVADPAHRRGLPHRFGGRRRRGREDGGRELQEVAAGARRQRPVHHPRRREPRLGARPVREDPDVQHRPGLQRPQAADRA